MIVTDYHKEYFQLIKNRPELFADSEIYPIVTDVEIINCFEKETHLKIGVLYKSKYSMLVVDLIKGKDGYFTYERIIPTATGKAVVCIPVFENRFILMDQYRHSIRDRQICFPRGFGEDGISSEENAKKELFEEIDATTGKTEYIGSITADSGLIGTECDVYLCYIENMRLKDEEGICDIICLDKDELEKKICNHEIKDGFTLSAYILYKSVKTSEELM